MVKGGSLRLLPDGWSKVPLSNTSPCLPVQSGNSPPGHLLCSCVLVPVTTAFSDHWLPTVTLSHPVPEHSYQ